jgi:hypothetical protein
MAPDSVGVFSGRNGDVGSLLDSNRTLHADKAQIKAKVESNFLGIGES